MSLIVSLDFFWGGAEYVFLFVLLIWTNLFFSLKETYLPWIASVAPLVSHAGLLLHLRVPFPLCNIHSSWTYCIVVLNDLPALLRDFDFWLAASFLCGDSFQQRHLYYFPVQGVKNQLLEVFTVISTFLILLWAGIRGVKCPRPPQTVPDFQLCSWLYFRKLPACGWKEQ